MSKDLKSNNVFDNNINANNNFRNIFEYKIFDNKELFFLQSTSSFLQLLIRQQQEYLYWQQNFMRQEKTLFEIYIIVRMSNISIELYILLTLRQKYNWYFYCNIY